ncbi:MAG: DEAD/DEAH box helicase [Bdellovibrionota bacterium]
MSSFNDFDLLESLRETLAEKEFTTPTEIQELTIPRLLNGKSVAGVAETGSGKTLAYALPLLHMVKSMELGGEAVEDNSRPRALVLVPSRDLGEQVLKVFKNFTHTTRVRVRPLLGGTTSEMGRRNVANTFEILVATPGRLVQFLQRRLIDLSDVRTLVFDEADQMLDQGFLPDANKIAEACPEDRQMVMFSATVSPQVQELINQLFGDTKVVKSEGHHHVAATLTTQNRTVENGKRFPLLKNLIAEPVKGGTIVFTNTREQCDIVAEEFKSLGTECAVYRGEMDKLERRKNLRDFRDGKVQFLVSTDLGARGLDVEHVGRVVNYHLPKQMDNYLHRVGRTARAGRAGVVINFVTERDLPLIKALGKLQPE